jgi:hypothetical protein
LALVAGAAVFALLAIGASSESDSSFFTPFALFEVLSEAPFDCRFLAGFESGSSSDSSLTAFLGVGFFFDFSEKLAFSFASLLPRGSSSSSDRATDVSLYEGGSLTFFFLLIGSSSLSESTFLLGL